MANYKTFANGGDITPNDVDAITSDADSVFNWRPLWKTGTFVFTTAVENIYVMAGGYSVAVPRTSLTAPYASNFYVHVDPTDDSGRASRFIIRATSMAHPSFAGNFNVDFGLWPVAKVDPGGSANVSSLTIGTAAIPGSAVRIANPVAGKIQHFFSGEFLVSQKSDYVVAMTPNVARTQDVGVVVLVSLWRRQVPS